MGKILEDPFIDDLIKEEKFLPERFNKISKMKSKSMRQHKEKLIRISGTSNNYCIVIRKNILDPLDFSIILRYEDPSGSSYNIVRYNGKHMHRNKLECESFRGFHIHRATERYQRNGYSIETYATPTNKYSSFEEAWSAFINDLNISMPRPPNTPDILRYGGE